ncbi:MAG: Adaptive-response sensory-kinase SasA [bacterium]|nr:Adaptive-response sensory-kinase SasA [bacterium]
MSDTFPLQATLRMRILLVTGGVLLALLLIISQVLLFQWREIIIARQYDSAVAVARTFAVAVIDALIEEEQFGGSREGVLQTYLDDFMRSLDNVKYVVVRDLQDQTLALSPAQSAGAIPAAAPAAGRPPSAGRLFRDPHFSWVIESRLPLHIAGKVWGTAAIGFDAAPIRKQVRLLFVLLFVTTMIVSCATLVVLHFLASRLTASLSRLVKEIDSVEFAGGPASPTSGTVDDIAFLFDRFDLMKQRIEQSLAQIESAQRQVYQAEKLASIGRLASGVAHQVNNPLHGIRSCLYAIRREPENTGQTQQYLALIEEEISNIETVVQKLLGFARQRTSSVSRLDIAAATRKVVSLFDLRLKEKKLHVTLDLPADLPLVAIDHQLFQEVVMNLLLNSYDAVGPGGEITITAGRQDGGVFLTVKDNGIGIRAEDLPSIFDPFFTTKEIGTGTGLGLAVCQSIVERHGGRISVQSAAGQGAAFTITLRVDEDHESSDH